MKSVPVLALRGLRFRHAEGATLLEDATLTIESSECVALVGRSGSGKSTLLQLIAGLLTPEGGEILVEGRALHTLQEPDLTEIRRDRIGFVYQQICLLPTLTLVENVALPRELAGMPRSEASAAARERLEQTGVADLADRFPDQVSGGEQQRAGIARALVGNPQLLLADEPTGSLDVESGKRVLEALLDVSRSSGCSVLMATHSAALAARADRILYLSDGVLVESDSADGFAW